MTSLRPSAFGLRFPRLRQPHLEWLLKRLAQANGQRRRFLLHRALHQERVLATEAPRIEAPSLEHDDRSEFSNDYSVATSVDLTSFTKALPSIEQDDDTESQASFMSYATSSGEDQLFSVQQLEQISEGRTLFVCPHCREEQKITTQYVWERHVHADLRTYVCISEGCSLSLFSTSQAWLQHHLDHLLSAAQETNIEDIDTISVDECRFCDWSSKMASSKSSTSTSRVSLQRFRRHICAHLEQVAMLTIDHDEVMEERADEDDIGSEDEADDHVEKEPDYRRISEWLQDPDQKSHRLRTSSIYMPWLFTQNAFVHWRQDISSLLILTGKADTGKTKLMSHVISRLKEIGEPILCFYFRHTNTENNLHQLIRSLVRQSIDTLHDDTAIVQLFASCGEGALQPSTKQLASCIASIAEEVPMTIVLDALDACVEFNQVSAWLEGIIASGRAKIFLSSRPVHRVLYWTNRLTVKTRTIDFANVDAVLETRFQAAGKVYTDLGDLDQEESMAEQALIGYEETLGAEDVLTLKTVEYLGSVCRDQGKLDKAKQNYMQALRGYEHVLGPEHPTTLHTVNNLGNLYKDQGKTAEAKQNYMQASRGYEHVLGPEHPVTLNTVTDLGSLYKDQGKIAEAERMYTRALAGYRKLLGPEHSSTMSVATCLDTLRSDQSRNNNIDIDAEKGDNGNSLYAASERDDVEAVRLRSSGLADGKA